MRKINLDAELERERWVIFKYFLRFEALTTVSLKIQVFWDVMMRHWVSGSQSLEDTKILQNIRNHSPNSTASQDLNPLPS
jgi:hypothetical protein